MIDLDEHAVFASAVGASLSRDRLENIASCVENNSENYTDCEAYLVEGFAYWDMGRKRRFRISSALIKKWHASKIQFQLYLYINEGRLIGGHIHRYKITSDGSGHPRGYLTSPTRQEIRLVARILDYFVNETPEK